MQLLLHDLRFACRTMAKSPVLAAIIVASLAIGIGAALLTQMMATLLFGVSAKDVLTFSTSALLLTLVALLACLIPARRAISVDPLTALREE